MLYCKNEQDYCEIYKVERIIKVEVKREPHPKFLSLFLDTLDGRGESCDKCQWPPKTVSTSDS